VDPGVDGAFQDPVFLIHRQPPHTKMRGSSLTWRLVPPHLPAKILGMGSASVSAVDERRNPAAAAITDPRSSGFAALVSIAAIAAALIIGSLQGPQPHDEAFPAALAIASAMAVGRYFALRAQYAAWVIGIDALLSLLVVWLTSAPHSEFHFVALAGIWWAGRLVPKRGAAMYAVAFLAPYVVVVLPEAWQQGALAEAVEDLLTVAVLALLVDWFLAVDRRAKLLSDAISTAEASGATPIEVRRRLALAAGESPLPVDTLMVAGQVGLTADQVELLGYLLLGFGNHQIADAIGRSEATVRYRLTSLYRSLGVRGRRAAVQRARDLGLDSLLRGLDQAR
jgi:DNA-binding CsgD family transcriptional regulator